MTKVKSSSILFVLATAAAALSCRAVADAPPAPPAAAAAPAPHATTFAGAMTGGNAHLEFRYRLEPWTRIRSQTMPRPRRCARA